MKKYFPIRIFSITFGYGWWWGSHFFFLKKGVFAIMPMWFHYNKCEYKNGKAIEGGTTHSWDEERQREKQEDANRVKSNV
jgi:hypothetical protein